MSTRQSKKIRDQILEIHAAISGAVDARIAEFKNIGLRGSEEELFIELVFCLLTPQSGARRCGAALENLIKKGCLFEGCFDDICPELNIVRFKNNKSRYILEARAAFIGPGGKSLRSMLDGRESVREKREWLVRTVKGMGYKEASHFLRNIGYGDDIAILDRHVLRNMVLLGLIDGVPGSISGRRYHELEETLRRFSRRIGVPLGHLDFVLWYKETGDIFK